MNTKLPRYSASEDLLRASIDHASSCGSETRLIRLNDLQFRACEGYYSKSAHACTWPCTITQMDPTDQLDAVYEALVFWADIVLIATPIRWGGPGSLYVKMTERLNCVQNQITTHDRVLIRNKVAAFIIVGGQDNVQAVAGQMMMFFGELGFSFPQFPFIGHSRGWSAEDMETMLPRYGTVPNCAAALVLLSTDLSNLRVVWWQRIRPRPTSRAAVARPMTSILALSGPSFVSR